MDYKKGSLIIGMLLASLSPPSYADCVGLFGNIKWQKLSSKEILMYRSGNAIAKIELDYGTYINKYSDVVILDDYPCSYSSSVFLIDDSVVGVRKIYKL